MITRLCLTTIFALFLFSTAHAQCPPGVGSTACERFSTFTNALAPATTPQVTDRSPLVQGSSATYVGSSVPTVATNAQLMLLTHGMYAAVLRLGVSAPGDAGAPLLFTSSGTACSLNSGAGDVGSQVPSSDGGCFNANHPAIVDSRQWGVAGGGSTDQAPLIQSAINYANSRGGGPVGVPAGQIVQKSQIVVQPNVTLQCANNGMSFGVLGVPYGNAAGTVFNVTWGSGSGSSDNPADADVILDRYSTINSCGFTYPDQLYTLTAPIEYGPTIMGHDSINQDTGQTATHNFCFNCYSFLDFRGSITALVGVSNMTVEYNWGSPIAYGFRTNSISDWSHYSHNIFHAGAFDISGFPGFGSRLAGWTLNHGIAFDIGNSDWVNLTDEQEWGYFIGVNIAFNNSFYHSAGPIWIIDSQFDACIFACIADIPSTPDTSGGNNGIMALRIKNNTFTAFNALTGAQSGSMGGLALTIDGNSTVLNLDFSGNFIFGPTNYVVFGEARDWLLTNNISYPNVASSIAAAGPAFTLTGAPTGSPSLATVIMTNNIMRGFNAVHSTIPGSPNLIDTGNFTN